MRRSPKRSRRDFLKGAAAAAAAAPYVVRSSVLGAAGPGSRVTVGLIGMGRQARHVNVNAFLHAPDAQVLAVCDVDAWRLENARKIVDTHYASRRRSGTYKGCAAYGDFRELLGREDIDAVMISTPDHWHAPMSVAAARAGKDVCCEKPITLTVEEGRAVSDTMKRYGRVYQVDTEIRSNPRFHTAAELVRNGRIGRLHTIRSGVPRGDRACDPQPVMPAPKGLDYDLWLGPAREAPYTVNRVHRPRSYQRPGWMRVRDYCEGMISNWGTHLNDIVQWGADKELTGPVEVEGAGTYPTDGLWNVLLEFEVKYRYADGLRLIYRTGRTYVRFEGEKGWIDAAWNSITASDPAILKSRARPEETHLPRISEKRNFLECIKSRSQTLMHAEVGHRTTTLCQIGHIAIQVGRKLKWDPKAERFENDEQANRLCRRAYRSPWHL